MNSNSKTISLKLTFLFIEFDKYQYNMPFQGYFFLRKTYMANATFEWLKIQLPKKRSISTRPFY